VSRWYTDPAARAFLAFGFLPWLALLSLAWELAQLPLYTLWRDAEPAYIAFAVAHCTLGDILIGAVAVLVALALFGEGALAGWRRPRLALVTALLAMGYTAFSEWMNVGLLRSWAYSPAMPTISLPGFKLGLSPLAQWAVIPPLALYLAGIAGKRAAQ
jgi:hypothetical protein